ncbi:hypothetical protein MTR67_023461 [Solanum verrucosum]|uniref:CCHC-type domain-containing protein n=1 Tax=Solanum verrucosum TaxID=315347 RepID=A0AAF0QV85_SOLVR|nr:hypothetical protein MTR67_023461 [Solanum verrucosum]
MNLKQGLMSVQEYELKFTQFSKYAPHMVVDPREQMSKFLLRVSDLVKTECRNVMLLGDMDISRQMAHDQDVEGDKLRELAKGNKNARTGNYEYSTQMSDGEIRSQFQQRSIVQECSSASTPSPRFREDLKGERCFQCGQSGHRLKDCPSARQGKGVGGQRMLLMRRSRLMINGSKLMRWKGSLVKDHVLNMMSNLNELEILGTAIDKESQKTPPSMAYIVDKHVPSSSKPAKAQTKKKKSCKVVAPGGS